MAKHRYAYFPGCVTSGSAREVQDAMDGIARILDIELLPLNGASCCGAGVMKQANAKLQISLNARTFAMAEAEGLDVLTPCASCQGNMVEDFVSLTDDEQLREEVNEQLEKICGLRFEGTMRMRHLLQVLVEDIGLLVHGDADEVVPPQSLPAAAEALQGAGWKEVYAHVMKGTGHGIAPDGLSVALAFMRDKLGL